MIYKITSNQPNGDGTYWNAEIIPTIRQFDPKAKDLTSNPNICIIVDTALTSRQLLTLKPVGAVEEANASYR